MKMTLPNFLICCLCLFGWSCTDSFNSGSGGNIPPGTFDTEWSIPSNSVFDGGPGKDGIPSIDAPTFSSTLDIAFLLDDDLILGIQVGDEVKGYPHVIMDWHEIVNDNIGGKPMAITYCPLTGTGIAWDRMVNGKETTFGVSGLLYNNNLIPYDRETDSNWSQMLLESVNGARFGEEIPTYSMLETTWETWKEMFPDAKVMNLNTGFNRQYGIYPYGDYRTNNEFLLFPLTDDDNRLARKERGMGVIVEEEAKYYRLTDFTNNRVVVFEDQIGGTDLLIVGSASQNFLVAFELPLDRGPEELTFEGIQDPGRAVLRDSQGNEYDVFGKVLSGPDVGFQLNAPQHFIGYWFSWGAFYPDLPIFNQ